MRQEGAVLKPCGETKNRLGDLCIKFTAAGKTDFNFNSFTSCGCYGSWVL